MRNRNLFISTVLVALLIMGLSSEIVHAQSDKRPSAFKKDKTGTNPLNFTFDARLYNEFQWLNTEGDGDQNITTFEFRAPIFGGGWQLRAKVRTVYLKADLNDDGSDDVDEFGFGDMDLRIITIPYLNMKKKLGLAPGLEVFINSASDDALGSGALPSRGHTDEGGSSPHGSFS